MLHELVAILVIDLVTMSMSLAHLGHSIDRRRLGSDAEPTRVGAEAHRPAHVCHVLLVFHERDHSVVAIGREFAGMTIRQANYVPRKLDDRGLHSEADAEERKARFARVANCLEHSLDATHT